jgi:hypothetical protein
LQIFEWEEMYFLGHTNFVWVSVSFLQFGFIVTENGKIRNIL